MHANVWVSKNSQTCTTAVVIIARSCESLEQCRAQAVLEIPFSSQSVWTPSRDKLFDVVYHLIFLKLFGSGEHLLFLRTHLPL